MINDRILARAIMKLYFMTVLSNLNGLLLYTKRKKKAFSLLSYTIIKICPNLQDVLYKEEREYYYYDVQHVPITLRNEFLFLMYVYIKIMNSNNDIAISTSFSYFCFFLEPYIIVIWRLSKMNLLKRNPPPPHVNSKQ